MWRMRNRIISLAAAAVLLLGLFAGCDSRRRPPSFDGEFDVPYPLGDAFTINANTVGLDDGHELKRFNYVVCEVTLELGDPGIAKVIDERLYRVREIVIFTIGGKSLDTINTPAQKAALAEELGQKINEEFNSTAVNRVVFSDYYFHRG